jgi:hypothetical protein
VWRYELSDDDEWQRVRRVTPSTGIATFTREWGDETNLAYVLLGIDPAMVLDAMDTGYNRMVIKKDVVMTIGGVDLDMEDPSEDYWNTDLLNAIVAKEIATPENKVTGEMSLRITLTAANGYVRSSLIRAVRGDELFVAPCLRVVSGGPFTVRLYNATTGQYFGKTQTYAGAEFAFLYFENETIPTTCDFWQVEIKGTSDDDVCILDSVSARGRDDTRYALATGIDDSYKVPLIHRMNFSRQNQTANRQYSATKLQPVGDLVYGTHYQLQMQGSQATQQLLEIEPDVDLRDDIFYLAARQQRNVVEPWDFKTDVTTAPRGELLAYLMYEISDLLAKETGSAYWVSAHLEWGSQLGEEVKPRAETPYQPPREVVSVKR